MLLKEYDEEFHISCEKKISYDDGFDDGVKQERARADKARQEADAANQKVEILARKLRGCSEEEIAAALNISADKVRECLAGVLER